jgi:regulator of sigma D
MISTKPMPAFLEPSPDSIEMLRAENEMMFAILWAIAQTDCRYGDSMKAVADEAVNKIQTDRMMVGIRTQTEARFRAEGIIA